MVVRPPSVVEARASALRRPGRVSERDTARAIARVGDRREREGAKIRVTAAESRVAARRCVRLASLWHPPCRASRLASPGLCCRTRTSNLRRVSETSLNIRAVYCILFFLFYLDFRIPEVYRNPYISSPQCAESSATLTNQHTLWSACATTSGIHYMYQGNGIRHQRELDVPSTTHLLLVDR